MSEKKLMSLAADMFGMDESKDERENEVAVDEVEIEKLIPYRNHPFKLYDDERFDNMVKSIKEFGVIVPIIIRPIGTEYEILSGHNRVNAAKKAGLLKVPVIIKDSLQDDEAMLIVTKTNLMQRSFSDMLHSERATALQQHHKALASQGKRTDILKEIETYLKADEIKAEETSRQLGEKLTSVDETGKSYKLSGRTVSRYLRICNLILELKERLDVEEIPFVAAVELSYLNNEEQDIVEEILSENNFKVDMKKAETLRIYSESKKLNQETAYSILSGDLNKKPKTNKPGTIKLKPKLINRFFTAETKQTEIEETIERALELYFYNEK
ncbi:ParB N-terminal domain-containing protein [Clostridium cellulovorans]|uniref:ParB domain protein nuclease n=1 Tax=Clostridium cellulovorans (strain ATCC 35296 / DSM 3052 / OCM 3 / 743B) TaxID=573061 RepID=D9SPT4_CLOC7|nr:ParB N-terminal domain-containing protein [Clostridium cellulovorans]ADL52070.1 ParB domain protein nuclease [Clostridium cellulovorans 743B]